MTNKMYLIVAGGRTFNNFEIGFKVLDEVTSNTEKCNITVVCGKAAGGDKCGEEWYKIHKHEGVEISEHIPDWNDIEVEGAVVKYNKFGKPYNAVAGHWRNSDMENEATHLVAFWDGRSTGTRDMINKIKKSGKPYRVFDYNGNLMEV